MSPAPASGALAGYRVVDLTANVLGPLATQLLGDAGADVIKIEPPEGDPMRHIGPGRSPGMGALFLNLNRNKRSVVLDLKTERGRSKLDELVAGADVLVHTMRPKAAAGLGLSYEAVCGRNPRLIYASATGFGVDTSRADRPAFDDTIQGASGLAWLNRAAAGAPRFLPTVIGDKFCGHVLANAIIAALLHRERTGQGQEVHVPMMDVMTAFNLVEHLWGATIREPERGLGYTRLTTPHRRPYETRDGYICVMAVTDQQWNRLFHAIGRPELAQDPRFAALPQRAQHIDALYGLLAEALRTRTSRAWETALAAADVPHSPANSLEELLVEPYLAEVGFFRPVEHPSEGAMLTLAPPVSYSRSPLAIRSLAPRLGKHDELLD